MMLRARLSLMVAAVVTVLICAGGLLFLHQLQTSLDAQLDTALRARADALVQHVGPDGSGDFQDAGAAGLLPPDQALAQVVDAHATVIDASEGARNGPLLTPQQLEKARLAPSALTSGDPPDSLRLLAVPVPDSGQPPVVVVVGTTRELPLQAVGGVRGAILLAGPVAVLLCAAGAWLLAGAALRPVERMRLQAERLTASDTSARLAVPATRDEVARLGETMNALLERLHIAMSRQRDFVVDAGHELRTPLTSLRTELELATRPGRTHPDLIAAVTRAAEDTDRLIELTESLLMLAHAETGGPVVHRRPTRLDQLVRDAAAAAQAKAAACDVRLRLEAPAAVIIAIDRSLIRQVIDNLLENALRFSPPGSTVTLRVTATSSEPRRAVLEVRDEGPGFPTAFLPHAFERFARGDSSRSPPADGGFGLGLSIVASLVAGHAGIVTVANVEGGGALVRIELPHPIAANTSTEVAPKRP